MRKTTKKTTKKTATKKAKFGGFDFSKVNDAEVYGRRAPFIPLGEQWLQVTKVVGIESRNDEDPPGTFSVVMEARCIRVLRGEAKLGETYAWAIKNTGAGHKFFWPHLKTLVCILMTGDFRYVEEVDDDCVEHALSEPDSDTPSPYVGAVIHATTREKLTKAKKAIEVTDLMSRVSLEELERAVESGLIDEELVPDGFLEDPEYGD